MAGFTKRSRRCVCCVIPVLPLVVIALYGHRYLLHVFHLKPLAPVGTAPFTTTPTGLDTVGLSSSKTTTTSLRTKYRTRTNLFKAASRSSRDFQLLDKTRVIVDVKQHSDVTKDPVKPDHFKSFRKTNNDFEASDPVLNDVTQHSDVTKDLVKPDLVNTVGKTNNDFEQSDPVLYHTNEKALFKALRNMGLHVTPGMGLRHEAAKTEYERRLMTTLPLVDFRSAPDEKKSKVHILFPKADYKVGDTIQFRVDLYDGYGRRRTSGGDEIRMRVTSPTGTASLAVQVQDLRNGSYLGTTFLQWKGTSIVKVYLTYPREFLREAARWRLTVHATFWQGMQFSNGNGVTETTACFPSHPVPGYASVCNMTSDNGGLPYYCGLPTDSRLACSHKQSTRALNHVPWVASDSHIKKLLDKIDTKPYRRLIPNQISIPTRARGSPGQRTLPPCRSLPSRRSWDLNSPRGWMDNGKWRPLFCSIRDLQPDDVEQCLTNHTLYLLGDSNMRVWWEAMKNMLTCNRVESGHKHRHRLCEMGSRNLTVKSAIHGYPTHSTKFTENVPLPDALKELRHHRRHLHRDVILVLHYYLHFSFFALDVFRMRVRDARRHLEDFLLSIPDARVFIRGPHVVLDGYKKHIERGDIYGPAYIQIWKEEFEGLWDRVTFLDFWDMTIATENVSSHPPPDVIKKMVRVLLGYICDS